MDSQDITKTESLSEEQLITELRANSESLVELQKTVVAEILQEQKEKEIKTLLTNPSTIALSTTKHDPGYGLDKVKKTVKQLFILYLTNQYVARAVNIRADTLVSKGYKILGSDKEGVQACNELVENSGGTNLFWQLSVNTDIAGDGFLEKLYNLKKNKILKLKHVHPITFSFQTDEMGRIMLNGDKEPKGYIQYYVGENSEEKTQEVSKDLISHLRFNTLGDEFTGMSTIQPGYNTIVRLMNMEYAAAEAAVKTANPLIVITANTKSPHQIALWGQILGRINGREQVFIPQDMTVEFKSPGAQNFSDYSDYFLNAVVATFGVPKGVLLGGSDGGGNRAEGIILTRHFYSVIRGNQRYMQDFFNEIFKEYAKLQGFVPPKLVFEDVAEDSAVEATTAIALYQADLITKEEARQMLGLEEKPGSDDSGFLSDSQKLQQDIKNTTKEAQFPETPGKKAGSQAGIKKAQKISPFSAVKPTTK